MAERIHNQIPTSLSKKAVNFFLGNSVPSSEIEPLKAKQQYLIVYEAYRDQVRQLDYAELPNLDHPWYRPWFRRRAVAVESAALDLTTSYWRRRLQEDSSGLPTTELSDHEKYIADNERFERIFSEMKPVSELTHKEVTRIRVLSTRLLPYANDDHKDVLYEVAQFSAKERKSIRQRTHESAKMNLQWEKKELAAIAGGSIAAMYGLFTQIDTNFAATMFWGNIPSILAVIPLAVSTAIMAEKTGVCPNVLSSVVNSFLKNAPRNFRVAASAVPVFLWEIGVKDILYNGIPLIARAISEVPNLTTVASGLDLFFLGNAGVITLAHLYESVWCAAKTARHDTQNLDKKL